MIAGRRPLSPPSDPVHGCRSPAATACRPPLSQLVGADEADAQRALDEAGTFEGATKRLMPTRHSAKAGESPAKKKRRVGAGAIFWGAGEGKCSGVNVAAWGQKCGSAAGGSLERATAPFRWVLHLLALKCSALSCATGRVLLCALAAPCTGAGLCRAPCSPVTSPPTPSSRTRSLLLLLILYSCACLPYPSRGVGGRGRGCS